MYLSYDVRFHSELNNEIVSIDVFFPLIQAPFVAEKDVETDLMSRNSTPLMVICGSPYSGGCIYLAADGCILLREDDLPRAFAFWFALFYILNVEYPKDIRSVLIFIQKCILKIEDNDSVPPAVETLFRQLQP